MIQTFLHGTALLAVDEEAFRVWGRFDHGKSSFGTTHVLVIVGIVALLVVAAIVSRVLARRAARTFTSDNQARQFRDLCAAHGLRRSARQLLQQLAVARGVPSADRLFIEPHHFEVKTLPPELKVSAAELKRLQQTLFG
jgi:hypothetical protein